MKAILSTALFLALLIPLTAANWTGAVSESWHNASNWSPVGVPGTGTDVTIATTATGYYPRVESSQAYCRNLTINSGTNVHVYSNILNVTGSLVVYGYITISLAPSAVYVAQDVTWKSGSQGIISSYGAFYCSGNMTMEANSQFSNSTGTLEFRGTAPTTLINHSYYTLLCNVVVNKPWAATMLNSLTVPATNTESIRMVSLTNRNGSSFIYNYSGYLYIWGDLLDQNTQTGAGIFCNAGYQCPNGANQSFSFASTNSYLNEVWTYMSGTLSLNSDMVLKGTLRHQNGIIEANDHSLYIGGHWMNQLSPAAFLEEQGTVVFNGTADQYCVYSENFNHLVLQKSSGNFLINNPAADVTSASHTWISGDLIVVVGHYAALDLAQPRIPGAWWAYPGGSIDIYQDATQGIDLCGKLQVMGGTIRVHGGFQDCSVADGGDARIEMTSGVLDFVDHGIEFGNFLYSTVLLVSGGTLRTSGKFWDTLGWLTFSGGDIELYGPQDVALRCHTNTLLHNLVVNKGGSRANTVYPNSSVNLSGDLILLSGILDLNGWNMAVGGDAYLRGTFRMNAPATLDVDGDVNWYSGATAVTSAGTINCGGDWSFEEGCSVNLYGSNQRLTNPYGGYIHAYSNSAYFGQLELHGTEEDPETLCDYGEEGQLLVAGNLVVFNPNTLNLVEGVGSVLGNSYIHSGGGLIVGDGGTFTTNGHLFLEGELVTGPGTAIVHGIFYTGVSSLLDVEWGIFRCDAPDNGDYIFLRGGLDLFHAGLEFPHLSLMIGAHPVRVFDTSYLTVGGDFDATASNSYQPNAGWLKFTGSLDSGLEFGTSSYASDLIIQKNSANQSVRLYTDLNVHGNLNVNSGFFTLNHLNLFCAGDVTVTGFMQVNSNAVLSLWAGSEVNVMNPGLMLIEGNQAYPAQVTCLTFPAAYYSFTVHPGATIGASHARFSFMDANGIRVLDNAFVISNLCFSHCRFSDGQPGGTLLRIETNQNLNLEWVEFPANTWSGSANIGKSLDHGRLTVTNYYGDFSGEAFDGDPFDRVDWGSPLPGVTNLTLRWDLVEGLVILEWEYSFACDGFVVYHALTPDGPWLPLGSTPTHQYSDSPYFGAKFYYVTAVDE